MLAATSVASSSTSAWAYYVGTGVTPDCHERLTIDALLEVVDEIEPGLIVMASSELSQNLTRYVATRYGLEHLEERHQQLAMVLFVGVRDLDTGGGAALNVVNLRHEHGGRHQQHAHCTRNEDDDYAAGDAVAVAGCRDGIVKNANRSWRASLRPAPDQIIDVPFVLDFYGGVDLPVWAPGFLLGRALHGLQDSFSHTLRTRDYRRITHVMNYTDAIGPVEDYDEARDGLRHSVAMDACSDDNAEIVRATRQATVEMIRAVASEWTTATQGAALTVVDRWIQYEPGCEYPDYCDSPWLDYAQSDESYPFTGCSTASDATPDGGGLGLVILVGLGLGRRRGRRPSATE
ncbi:MAG: hypothetical protein B7733_10800 [Myxococcales bacterium FL481]|nr:MAG: hypothetical protein B7733_10800 [Myxococcales bacterium FL481]